jgi:phage shock protein C
MTDPLYRSRDERMFAGVAGGVAERFDLDPSLVRVVWIILMFLTGSLFFWLYVAMAIVVPEAPSGADRWAGWTTVPEHGSGAVAGWGSTTAAGTSAFASSEPPSGTETPPSGGSTAGADSIPDVAAPGEPPPAGALGSGEPPPPPLPPPPSGSETPPAWSPTVPERHRRGGGGRAIGGIVLILLGGYFLLRTVAPDIDLGAFWPVVLIIVGIALLFGSIRPGRGEGG